MRAVTVLTVLFLFIGCGPKVPDGAIMMVGERVLYPADVLRSMERVRGDSASARVMRDNILARELFLQHAGDLGLDTLPEVVRRMHERRREILQNAYIQRLSAGIVVNPDEFQAFCDSLGVLVVYSSFYASDSTVLNEFMDRLEQGEDFNALVSVYSTDQFIRETGGRVGPVPLVRTNREDYAVLRNLEPGQVGQPFFRRPGWRVVKLNDIRVSEPTPEELAELNLELIYRALRLETVRLRTQDSLVTAAGLEIHLPACSLIASRAGSARGDYQPFTPEEQRMDAITWEGGSRSLISLAMNITELPPSMPRNATDPGWIAEYAFYLGLYDLQAQVATGYGLDTLPENASQIGRRVGETLLDEYYLSFLQRRMVLDEELLQQHYLSSRDTLLVPERRKFVHAAAQGAAQVALLNRLFREGTDPVTESDQLTFIPQLSETPGSALTIPMAETDFPEDFRARIMALQPGEAMICSLETEFHVYFRLSEIIPGHVPSLDEIRHILEPRVMAEVEVRVISGLVDSLEEVYHPYIDEEFFASFGVPVEAPPDSASQDEGREDDL